MKKLNVLNLIISFLIGIASQLPLTIPLRANEESLLNKLPQIPSENSDNNPQLNTKELNTPESSDSLKDLPTIDPQNSLQKNTNIDSFKIPKKKIFFSGQFKLKLIYSKKDSNQSIDFSTIGKLVSTSILWADKDLSLKIKLGIYASKEENFKSIAVSPIAFILDSFCFHIKLGVFYPEFEKKTSYYTSTNEWVRTYQKEILGLESVFNIKNYLQIHFHLGILENIFWNKNKLEKGKIQSGLYWGQSYTLDNWNIEILKGVQYQSQGNFLTPIDSLRITGWLFDVKEAPIKAEEKIWKAFFSLSVIHTHYWEQRLALSYANGESYFKRTWKIQSKLEEIFKYQWLRAMIRSEFSLEEHQKMSLTLSVASYGLFLDNKITVGLESQINWLIVKEQLSKPLITLLLKLNLSI